MTIYLATDAEPPAGTKLYDRLGRTWWPLRRLEGRVRWQCHDSQPRYDTPSYWGDMTEWAPFRTEPVTPPTVTPEIRMWALEFALNAMRLTAEHGVFEADDTNILTVADNYANYALTGEHFE